TALTNRKDLGREAREAAWAAEQRTLNGLQFAEPKWFERSAYGDINLMAEEAKKARRNFKDIDEYNKGCRFLPKLNNELHRNSAYKERFASLQGLVLIMFENDTILVPKETSWFGYFPDSSWTPVLPAQETTLYTEDRIGLKSLDEAGKVKFVKVTGGHLEISYSAMKEYILPYLVENATTRLNISSESSHIWPWSEHEGERLQLYTAN
ncbi:palmitoyl- thioesterase 1-like, partial [Olea europaea subsp. europaea]